MSAEAVDFDRLRRTRNGVRALLQKHVDTLQVYRVKEFDYVHRFDETTYGGAAESPIKPSSASTATCIDSLVARSEDLKAAGNSDELLKWLFNGIDNSSAGLWPKNPFTTAFMLEAALLTARSLNVQLSSEYEAKRKTAAERLKIVILHDRAEGQLPEEHGGRPPAKGKDFQSRAEVGSANIEPYPPTAFLTQLVIRALQLAGAVDAKVEEVSRRWARETIEHEISLLVAEDELSDPYALAYAAITFASISKESRLTPQEKRLLSLAIDRVFQAQNDDGSWPRSRPLFHYEEVGNAYCFEYEMLTQLLLCGHLSDDVYRHMTGLERAVAHLAHRRYDLELTTGDSGAAWASGHHPQIRGPESWSTASVYHFLHLMERFLSDVLKGRLFARLKGNPDPLVPKAVELNAFATEMLDSDLYVGGSDTPQPLKQTIRDNFLRPLKNARPLVEGGKRFPVKMSMLMFGPPGTSKTSLAEDMAKVLGWPLLQVDPSHILVDGWDRVHATAIRLLDDLAEIDSAVVLLDEFDELVRTRGGLQGEPISRFFTTAMLPKLIKLNKERRIVLLMATNFVDQFDDAITREGRFDAVVQVLPPTEKAKKEKWSSIARLEDIKGFAFGERVNDLTFPEAKRFAEEVVGVTTKAEAEKVLKRHHDNCSMIKKPAGSDKSWKELCKEQRSRIRI